MRRHTPTALLAAFIATFVFVGVYGSAYRAALTNTDCVGKTYGAPGCPIKQESRSCGNGRVDAGEECDNGEGRNGEGNCSARCQFLACGDGVVTESLREECEPMREEVYAIDPESGQLVTELRFMAASCGETCAVPTCDEKGVCFGGCTRVTKPACGQSSSSRSSDLRPAAQVLASSEDSASSVPSAPEASSSSSVPYVPRCGNALKDPGEQCDDGNAFDNDSCTISCKLPRCGDGTVQRGETCDDGNTVNDDGCSNKCAKAACGDSIVQKTEQCDSGGNNSDYLPNACRSDCSAPRCGDAVVDNGEDCDGGESCTAECRRVKSFLALVTDTPGLGKAAIILSLLGGALVLAFVLRRFVHRVVKKVAGEDVARSIDDIPLDEIEMPWHTWGERDNK